MTTHSFFPGVPDVPSCSVVGGVAADSLGVQVRGSCVEITVCLGFVVVSHFLAEVRGGWPPAVELASRIPLPPAEVTCLLWAGGCCLRNLPGGARHWNCRESCRGND